VFLSPSLVEQGDIEMKLKKRLAVVTVALSLALTQTSCLSGIAFWPLWIVGSAVGAMGIGLTVIGPVFDNSNLFGGGIGLMLAGSVLDAENPGRADALNELPMSEEFAKNANVKVADIKTYNRELDQVRKVGVELANDIRSQVLRRELSHASSVEQLSRDPQIDRLAGKYGFESGEALFDSFNKKALPAQNLSNFAKNMDLTQGQAKLLLYYGFGVKTQ
jgi:hypothetical protein